ncbi:MAG: hypothetical protein WCO58_01615 [bacterium]
MTRAEYMATKSQIESFFTPMLLATKLTTQTFAIVSTVLISIASWNGICFYIIPLILGAVTAIGSYYNYYILKELLSKQESFIELLNKSFAKGETLETFLSSRKMDYFFPDSDQ